MSKARLVITAVIVEHRSVSEVSRTYGVHRSWIYRLLARYRAEGEKAFQPRSRRPRTSPAATPESTVKTITGIRQQLVASGVDAGPDTIVWHLAHHHNITISAATVARILTKEHLVAPAPKKRPKSSYVRFQADMPNETWQSDFTHYRLTDGTDTEIITWLDDHSRYALHISAHPHITGPIAQTTFLHTAENHGYPASVLTDNGLVYTTRFAGRSHGRNGLETELARHSITQKNSRPNHPTTCGKVERFQQTMKAWLTRQPHQPDTITELQTLLNTFATIYNHHRPHRSLPHRATPATIYNARPKATPTTTTNDRHYRVLNDKVDKHGKLTLRVNGKMHHIGMGIENARTPVLKLVDDLHLRVINAATGELLRELTIDTTRNYQPLGRPPGPPPGQQKTRTPNKGPGCR